MEKQSKSVRPEEYRGYLTPQQAVMGMNAAIRNAQRLLFDAKLLHEAGRHPTAAVLSILSIEESGKVPILRHLLGTHDSQELVKEWRRYRDHRSKNGAWIVPQLVGQGARKLHEFAETINREADHTILLNVIKQIGLYTDCFEKTHWSEPNEVIDSDLAKSLIKIAEILAPKKEITLREIELWAKIVAPKRKTKDLPDALLEWATILYSEGLSDKSPEEYAKFVFGEPGSGEWVVKPKQ
jgi:AbiV family abortive infection protein